MGKKKVLEEKNKPRGIAKIHLGGQTRTLRFRTAEIAALEGRFGCGITKILNEEQMGLRFLMEALMVGVAHEFSGKKGKEAKLSTAKVARWIDDSGDFTELLQVVIESIIDGLPMNVEQYSDDDDEGDDENPFVPSQDTSDSTSTSL